MLMINMRFSKKRTADASEQKRDIQKNAERALKEITALPQSQQDWLDTFQKEVSEAPFLAWTPGRNPQGCKLFVAHTLSDAVDEAAQSVVSVAEALRQADLALDDKDTSGKSGMAGMISELSRQQVSELSKQQDEAIANKPLMDQVIKSGFAMVRKAKRIRAFEALDDAIDHLAGENPFVQQEMNIVSTFPLDLMKSMFSASEMPDLSKLNEIELVRKGIATMLVTAKLRVLYRGLIADMKFDKKKENTLLVDKLWNIYAHGCVPFSTVSFSKDTGFEVYAVARSAGHDKAEVIDVPSDEPISGGTTSEEKTSMWRKMFRKKPTQ